MSLIFTIIVLTSIWVLGLTIVTQKDMALHNIRVSAEAKQSAWFEPLILCHWCMPSIHSVIGYAFAFGLGIITEWSWKLLAMYPLIVMGSSILCGLVWTVYLLMEIAIKYLKHRESLAFFDLKDRKENFNQQKVKQNGNITKRY